MNTNKELSKEDYVEPRCLLCDEPFGKSPDIKPVPQQRIMQKVDEYMSRRDYAGVERHLLYWLEEARLGHDLRGELMIENELIGHYRKMGNESAAMSHIDQAIALIDKLDYAGSISAGTTYVNAATACEAFGHNEKAAVFFSQAKEAYESAESVNPSLLGGLYNNMALNDSALQRFDEAMELYQMALKVMGTVPGGGLEQAITYLNMADTEVARKGTDSDDSVIFKWLDLAEKLLLNPDAPQDGYYAFVCEKCAPSFSVYGYFATAKELKERAEKIYAGS